MKKIAGIYQILNKINGKSYIGSSVNIYQRWAQHKSKLRKQKHVNKILQRAWNKYFEISFHFLILEEILVPIKEILESREQHYLDQTNPEYNILKVAYSPIGQVFSKESKEKMSRGRLGFKALPETRLIQSLLKKGKPSPKKGSRCSEEQKKKMSISRKGVLCRDRKPGKADKISKEDVFNLLTLSKEKSPKELSILFSICEQHVRRILKGKIHREDYFHFYGHYPLGVQE